MRLGILPFAERLAAEATITEALSAEGIDVVTAEEPVVSGADVRREASRLHRVSCDGILFLLHSVPRRERLAEAALHLADLPLLVASEDPQPAQFVRVFLSNAGAPTVDMANISGLISESALVDWLKENRREERQRGFEAARKLYGLRLSTALPLGQTAGYLPEWARRFGLVILEEGDEEADFAAEEGDMLGALTARLMSAIAPDSEVKDAVVGQPFSSLLPDAETVTLARFFNGRRGYSCLIKTLPVQLQGRETIPEISPEIEGLPTDRRLRLYAVAGNHIGAMRAACDSLAVEPYILR